MTTTPDAWASRLSFFGRVADELDREALAPGAYTVGVRGVAARPEYKHAGYFVFQDLKPSTVPYEFDLAAAGYQARTFAGSAPTPDPVELTFGGEDEVYVVLKTVNVAAKTVVFDPIPFVTRVAKQAPVIGPGAFSTTLAESLEGVDVTSATLVDVTGLGPGNLLRIVRSHSLLAKPGPSYPFPASTTRVHVSVVEDAPGEAPLPQAQLVVQSVQGVVPAATTIGGVQLFTVALPGPLTVVLGQQRDRETVANDRGQAVLFLPGHWPVTQLVVAVSAAGHVTKSATLALVPKQRTLATVKLTPA